MVRGYLPCSDGCYGTPVKSSTNQRQRVTTAGILGSNRGDVRNITQKIWAGKLDLMYGEARPAKQ